jgi:pyridoxal 5'-phosphate synthase pdxS subunit
MNSQIRWLTTLDPEEMMNAAKELRAPIEVVREVAETGALPVVNFAAGGIATPSDAALMMQLGCDGIFVGSGVFKSDEPDVRARAIVEATTFYQDPGKIATVSKNLGEAMVGINIETLPAEERMQDRGS